jgi:uncharacterized membrane protein
MNKIILIGIILLCLDYLYLSMVKDNYQKMMINIQGSKMKVKLVSAAICYILMTFALYYFIIKENKSIFDAFLLGVVIYGIYDSTNYATINNWSPKLAIIDTLWGGVLYSTTTYILYNYFS